MYAVCGCAKVKCSVLCIFSGCFTISIAIAFHNVCSIRKFASYTRTGIASHFEDEDAFGPIIATISLISPTLMLLKHPKEHNNDCEDLHPDGLVKVLLEDRSLFVMQGDCRYKWRHGISRTAKCVPLPFGGVLKRDSKYRRISLTIRHVLESRRRVKGTDITNNLSPCISESKT